MYPAVVRGSECRIAFCTAAMSFDLWTACVPKA